MAITFDVGNGTFVRFEDDTTPVDTQRGMVLANEVVQGDFIRNINGVPRIEVVAVPVVS